MRTCLKCGERKEKSAFPRNGHRIGLTCIECEKNARPAAIAGVDRTFMHGIDTCDQRIVPILVYGMK
jgi:hypothetical protein